MVHNEFGKGVELTDVEKKILLQIEDGFGSENSLIFENPEIPKKNIKKIFNKFINLKLISFDPYKDKDLNIYLGLKTKKKKKDFKKNNPPSFFVTEKGRKLLEIKLF